MRIEKEIRKKNRRKRWRTGIQIVICLGTIFFVALRSYSQSIYDDSNKNNWNQTQGFSIISYPGVREEKQDTLISKNQLNDHFTALKREGYETVGIDDVMNFYMDGSPLPDKAILILFEDGQRETYLTVQPLLKQYNFKATMMTYAYDLVNYDRGQLKSKDLSILTKSTYWDIGSNGYRYSKINVMNSIKEDGEVEETYNHYLLDYLRDEDGVPTEAKEEMEKRITWDYEQMDRIYSEALEEEIKLYRMMHSDALFGSINHAIERVNLEKIEEIFSMMINREGSCYNSNSTPIYNLTKMSVSPDWEGSDLVNELNTWTQLDLFYQGIESEWYVKEGELRLDEGKLILTPNQHHRAFTLLKGTQQQDSNLLFYLTESEALTQNLYLRYDELQQTYVKVSLSGNKLKITQKTSDGIEKQLYETVISLEELIEYQANSLYYKMDATNPITPISWKIKLQLQGNELIVVIGGKGESVMIDSSISQGHIALETVGESEVIFDALEIKIK